MNTLIAFHKFMDNYLFEVEGRYSNSPVDRGGETFWGLASAYHDVGPETTREQAIERYQTHYWQRAACDKLPAWAAVMLLDAAINHGVSSGIRLLQRSVRVKQDGLIGPLTVRAVTQKGALACIPRYLALRHRLYSRLAMKDDSQKVFLEGWHWRLHKLHAFVVTDILPPPPGGDAVSFTVPSEAAALPSLSAKREDKPAPTHGDLQGGSLQRKRAHTAPSDTRALSGPLHALRHNKHPVMIALLIALLLYSGNAGQALALLSELATSVGLDPESGLVALVGSALSLLAGWRKRTSHDDT